MVSYFCKYRNVRCASPQEHRARGQVCRPLLGHGHGAEAPHHATVAFRPPEGVVGDIQEELEIPNSTLSHHLDKLKNEDLVHVRRESTCLRYTANTEALQELLQFLYAECCTRNQALQPQDIIRICK
jgi:ArsR family transcriptional regulator, arsenate/arsenite/antimonite-responsive transcriptional repressor